MCRVNERLNSPSSPPPPLPRQPLNVKVAARRVCRSCSKRPLGHHPASPDERAEIRSADLDLDFHPRTRSRMPRRTRARARRVVIFVGAENFLPTCLLTLAASAATTGHYRWQSSVSTPSRYCESRRRWNSSFRLTREYNVYIPSNAL